MHQGQLDDEPLQAKQREVQLELERETERERERDSLPLAEILNDIVKSTSVTYARLSE